MTHTQCIKTIKQLTEELIKINQMNILLENEKIDDYNRSSYIDLKKENTLRENNNIYALNNLYNELAIKYDKLFNSNNILEQLNNNLKTENIKLNGKIFNNSGKISSLENEIKDSHIKIDKLEIEFKETKLNDANRILFNMDINIFYYTIQELNRIDNLELQFSNPIKKYLIDIKNDRNNDVHYFDDKLSIDEILYRRYIMLQKFNSMSDEIKNYFDEKFPTFIETLKPFIYQYNDKPQIINEEKVDRFWRLGF